MRILASLLAALCLPLAAAAQEAAAPEGAVIESAEVLGLDIDHLSPGLRRDIESLVGGRLDQERVAGLAARIEGERPDVVAAARSLATPAGKARVAFIAARISDDTGLLSNINARYTVESVEIAGIPEARVSRELRRELQRLVGSRLDPDEADRLSERLAGELHGRRVTRRISRGTEPGRIHVVFEVNEIEPSPWIPFIPSRSKLVYHGDQGWSGVIDVPIGARRHRATVGLVFGNQDDLVEEYSGFRVRLESRALATDRLGASLEVARYRQSWDDRTLSTLALDPAVPEAYRTRVTVEPRVTFAASPHVRFTAGASISELESLAQSPASQMANAAILAVGFDRDWQQGSGTTDLEAGYTLRAARPSLGSDLDYTRHLAQGRVRYKRGKSTVIATTALGYLAGGAPLFERFTLGDSATLRGWNKFDLTPAGADRMVHQSLEYRFHGAAFFFDAGSVWDRGADARIRLSTGVGFHTDNGFLTLAVPLNAEDAGATFMMGVRF